MKHTSLVYFVIFNPFQTCVGMHVQLHYMNRMLFTT